MPLAGPFGRTLRPDEPKKRHKPFTLPGTIVHERMRTASLLLGGALVFAAAGGGLAYWGMQQRAAPPPVLVATLDRTGQLVNMAYTAESKEAEEALINATLAEVVWRLRRLTPDEPMMFELWEEKTKPFFANAAEARMAAFWQSVGFYKKEIEAGLKRRVEGDISARKRVGTENEYRVSWAEQMYRANGAPIPESRREHWMEATVVKDTNIKPGKRKDNPAAIYITDMQWSVVY